MRSSLNRIGRASALVALVFQLSACAYSSWEQARKEDSLAGYSQFIRDHPTSPFVNDAQERMTYLRVKTYKTRESFEEFARLYPKSELIGELHQLMEPLYFAEARSANTAAAYESFLEHYPDSALSARAIGNRAYVSDVLPAPSEEVIRAFVDQHPESDFADEAGRTLELMDLQRQTRIRKLGVRVEVAPNVAQPTRVRLGFASMFAQLYRERGVQVSLIEPDAGPGADLDGWVTIDYREAPASGVLGAGTVLADCRVRLYHRGFPDPIWDRSFEAPADHLAQGAFGRDQTVFGSSKYRFWEGFFVPVATWAVSQSHVQEVDYLEDVQALDVLGERAVLLLERGGVDFLDISSPPKVSVIDRYRRELDLANWTGVRLLRPDLAVTYGTDGLEIIRRTESAAERMAKFDGPTVGAIRGAVLYDSSTLLVGGSQGLYAIRMNRSPLVPQRLLDGDVVAVESRPPYIVVVRPNRVELALPKHLLLHLTEKKIALGRFDVTKARLLGDQLFLLGSHGVLHVSLANPQSPKIARLLTQDSVGKITDLAGDRERLYLLGDRGLQVAFAGKAGVRDFIQVKSDRAMAVHGRFAVLVGNHAMEVLDLSPYAMGDYIKEVILPAARTPAAPPAAHEDAEHAPPGGAPAQAASAQAEPGGPALPSFPGISAAGFSDASIPAIKALFPCGEERAAPYCAALDRFAAAQPLAADARGYWTGTHLIASAVEGGKPGPIAEGATHLYLKDQKGCFPFVKSAEGADAGDLQTLIDQLRGGVLPADDSPLRRYLAQRTPEETYPLQPAANSLSFTVPIIAGGQPVPPVTAFLRENAEEILAVEIWGDGHSVRIVVLPKKFASANP